MVISLKKKTAEWWDGLTKEKSYKRFIKTDFAKWCEEEDREYMGDMGPADGMDGMDFGARAAPSNGRAGCVHHPGAAAIGTPAPLLTRASSPAGGGMGMGGMGMGGMEQMMGGMGGMGSFGDSDEEDDEADIGDLGPSDLPPLESDGPPPLEGTGKGDDGPPPLEPDISNMKEVD